MPKHRAKRKKRTVQATCPVGYAPKVTAKTKKKRGKVTFVVTLGRCVKVCNCQH